MPLALWGSQVLFVCHYNAVFCKTLIILPCCPSDENLINDQDMALMWSCCQIRPLPKYPAYYLIGICGRLDCSSLQCLWLNHSVLPRLQPRLSPHIAESICLSLTQHLYLSRVGRKLFDAGWRNSIMLQGTNHTWNVYEGEEKKERCRCQILCQPIELISFNSLVHIYVVNFTWWM